jgi:hypothetical protein
VSWVELYPLKIKIYWSLYLQYLRLRHHFVVGLYRVSKIKKRLSWWALINMTGVLIKRGNLDTDKHTGRTLCENEDRCLDEDFTGQLQSKTPEARREAWNLSQPSAVNSANTLTLDSKPSEL